jgi:hypothetical protein
MSAAPSLAQRGRVGEGDGGDGGETEKLIITITENGKTSSRPVLVPFTALPNVLEKNWGISLEVIGLPAIQELPIGCVAHHAKD